MIPFLSYAIYNVQNILVAAFQFTIVALGFKIHSLGAIYL